MNEVTTTGTAVSTSWVLSLISDDVTGDEHGAGVPLRPRPLSGGPGVAIDSTPPAAIDLPTLQACYEPVRGY